MSSGSYPSDPFLKLANFINQGVLVLSKVICWCYLLLVVAIIVQVTLRKGFASGFIPEGLIPRSFAAN